MIPFPGPSTPVREDSLVDAVRGSETVQWLRALGELTKPGVTRMVVMTTWCGAAMAPGPLRDYGRLGWALVGTALVVAAAGALNMYLEGDVGVPMLALLLNAVTAFIGLFALLSYVLVYTPMKRVSPLAVWVGAVPGAVP